MDIWELLNPDKFWDFFGSMADSNFEKTVFYIICGIIGVFLYLVLM